MSQSESGGLQAQVIPSHFPVFIWSWIHASGVICSWLILALPSVTVCPCFLSLHASRASELHSSIDRILQTTSVPSVDCSFILEWVDCLFKQLQSLPLTAHSSWNRLIVSSKTQMHDRHRDPSIISVFFHLSSLVLSISLLFGTWILNQVGSSLAAQIWASACSSLCFKLDPSTQSHTSVIFPSFLALIPPPSPSYPPFSITFL